MVMPSFIPIIFLVIYTVLVVYWNKKIVSGLILSKDEQARGLEKEYERLCLKRDGMASQKSRLETTAAEIFTLYELTREVTKNFHQNDALETFCNKLRQSIPNGECWLLEPDDKKLKEFQDDPRNFLFELKGRTQVLGHLAIQGVQEADMEKVMILTHQFALGLRRIRLYQDIEKLAISDSLTQVGTRRYILEHFEKELQRSKAKGNTLSFLMIDVDFFKKINDQHGHMTGDMVLRGVAAMIRSNIREIDLAGRYGGEEFCVVLPDTDCAGAKYVAERIRSAVEKEPIRAYDTVVKTTVSIGFVTFPKEASTCLEMIDKADSALYRAKKAGRNMVMGK